MSTYDLKTLYTSIPRDLSQDKMKCFLERIIQRKGKKFIILTINGAYFTDKSNNKILSLMQLLECICFFIDNGYVVLQQ